jgi:hypothetical protein
MNEEKVMTLPAGQQQTLDDIAGTLQARDPRLASMFSIFTRLTRHEPMPRAEELAPVSLWLASRGLCGRLLRARLPGTRVRASLVVPVVLAALVSILVILIPAGASASRCSAPTGTAHSAAHASTCRATGPGPAGYPVH